MQTRFPMLVALLISMDSRRRLLGAIKHQPRVCCGRPAPSLSTQDGQHVLVRLAGHRRRGAFVIAALASGAGAVTEHRGRCGRG